MEGRKVQQWLCGFSFSLLLLITVEGLFVDITILESAVEKGAVCLDGSPPAYHLDRGFGNGVNNWLVQIEGGGWCNNIRDCNSRRRTHLGSSKLMETPLAFSGIMSNDYSLNPYFYNWNRVKVRYCDGASFTGDVEVVNPVNNLHFRGARIFQAVMEDLLAKGMKNARNAILSGCSAGGLTSILHCDKFKAFLPHAGRVKCLSDAGFFIDVKTITGEPIIQQFYNDVVTLHGSAKNLHRTCMSKLNPGLCFFPQNTASYIQTPLFLINSAYDYWQVRVSLIPDHVDPSGEWMNCKTNLAECQPQQLNAIQGFRSKLVRALNELGPSSARGYYINSCYLHCHTELQNLWHSPNSPRLFNKTIAEAAGEWFFDRNQFQKIDCPYPCNKSCFSQSNS
ncbi:PREDICTED: pectin acetylesterase 8-like [Ipomoea nil]|uniref:pectin acetylesterase 8-like n=1 Tax=Ipomoea nil TaxID=35883 RepID=UPI000901EF8B|nr:PREDICTED: pectin acetylesterase 8-like [Ipomoea nil]XP_019156705.1 PREDICTED: pectin acetylesterase 8-like [Ipomoea nil]